MKGVFVTFEGAEGSGKSTQLDLIKEYLHQKKVPVEFLREPGGVKISESVRRILLNVRNQEMSQECEMLLYMAARAQLVSEKIAPALKRGRVVLCDRYLDSTLAYQGYGHGVDLNIIAQIGRFATQALQPDLTLLFDLDAAEGLARRGRIKDRIEQRSLAYHQRVRQGYLELAKKDPFRIKVIKADQTREEIHAIVRQAIDEVLERRRA